MKITLTEDNGTEHDITDSIPFMYDAIIQSMDWGSGFLDLEEQLHIASVGILAGYEVPDGVQLEGEPTWRDFIPERLQGVAVPWTQYTKEEGLEADKKLVAARTEWQANYNTRLRAAILSQIKQFEMDEDN